MNKARCKNGHFFNLALFSACPICGAPAAGDAVSKKPKPPAPSRIPQPAKVDQTEIMDESVDDSQVMIANIGGNRYKVDRSQNPSSQRPSNTPVSVKPDPEPIVSSTAPEKAPTLLQQIDATGHNGISPLPKTTYLNQENNSAEVSFDPVSGWLVCLKGIYRGQSFACGYERNPIGRNPSCRINLSHDTSINREPHAIVIYEPRSRQFFIQPGTGNGLVYLNGEPVFSHQKLQANDRIELGTAEFLFVPLCGENFSWDSSNS